MTDGFPGSDLPTDERAPAEAPPPIRMPRPRVPRSSFRRTAGSAALLGAFLGLVVGTLVSVAVGSSGTAPKQPRARPPVAATEPDEDPQRPRAAARAELRRAAFDRAMQDVPRREVKRTRKPPSAPPPAEAAPTTRPRIRVPLSEVTWVRSAGSQGPPPAVPCTPETAPEPAPEPVRAEGGPPAKPRRERPRRD